MRRTLFFAIPALLISILACNMPGTASGTDENAFLTLVAQTLTATTHETATATVTGAASATSGPTSTQASPTAGGTAVPCNRASFVTDVTIPDNTVIGLNQAFTKTWKLKNVGSCSWTSGYQLIFDTGDQMGGPASQQLTTGTVASGQTLDVSVDLHAPATAGTYKGFWKLRESGGTTFGLSTGSFWVQIKAQAAVAPLPQWPITNNGDSGPVVTALQHLLKAHGEDLPVDGLFGPVTKSKVEHFQSVNGLTVDGLVGAQTWPKLIIQVQQGSTGQAVRAVQALLNGKFGYSLSVDGIFGPDTNAAVKDYQSDHGLTSDGIVGPKTWQSMIGS